MSDAKTLGGIGSILVLLTAVPYAGWAFGIAGFVMILFAIKNISEYVGDRKIYSDMIISVIMTIGAIAVGTVVVLGTVLRVFSMGTFVGSRFVPAATVTTGDWISVAIAAGAGLVVVWALAIASTVFLKKSLDSVAAKLKISTFGTAGLIYLIGAATAIIGVGFLLMLVAQILLVISFFSIQDQKAPEVIPPQPSSMSS